MKLYECNSIPQVARKVAELTKTKLDRACWKEYCNHLKKQPHTTDTIDYIAFDDDGNEIDVTIELQYDESTKQFLVGMEANI